jgi:hypothetical protein
MLRKRVETRYPEPKTYCRERYCHGTCSKVHAYAYSIENFAVNNSAETEEDDSFPLRSF